jgi:hypothetical protein
MDENRFFRFVWRFNGIAIMLLALTLLVWVIVLSGYALVASVFFRDHSPVITSVAEDPEGKEQWRLGAPRSIDGTQFLCLPLESEKKSISASGSGLSPSFLNASYSSRYFDLSRNLLFVNRQTRDMYWLFKDNRQLITDVELLSPQDQDDRNRVVDAILYRVVQTDTNADQELTAEDLADVAISNPDGTSFTMLFQSVERMLGSRILESGQVLILYQSQGKGYAATIRLQDMSVQETKEMPKVEEAS